MDQIVYVVHGAVNRPVGDDLSMKIELEEAAAKLETLHALGNAIRQHRELLESHPDWIAKIELTIPMR